MPACRLFLPAIRVFCVLCCFSAFPAQAQRFLSDYDSTLFLRDTMVEVVSRFEHLHISAYIQPQFQVASAKGANSYEGGNFTEHSNNRFMLRRARFKFDYQLPKKGKPLPLGVMTFQMDINERRVTVRDIFVRLYEPKGQNFSFTLGMFARPFGYEVNLSSQYRESPERARASQVLMPSERDLGAMITYDPVKRRRGRPALKWDLGMFNGQGIAATSDFDSYKDLISRVTLKPYAFNKSLSLSGGLSLLYGGWRQDTRYRWEPVRGTGKFAPDSTESNEGTKAPRHYYGADLQLQYKHGWGKTEIRGEYWWGVQPGTAESTENPNTQPQGPTYVRPFAAGIFYFLQNIGSPRWELGLKYDWYDANRYVSGMQIGAPGGNLTAADIRYSNWSGGLTWYWNEHVKVLAWYAHVVNERSQLNGYTNDRPDDVFTLRTQFRF
ncbi:MAG: porin [Chitinophagaceae bacterium]|nr:MAG: porin [Chitinophagaceae bacterium]